MAGRRAALYCASRGRTRPARAHAAAYRAIHEAQPGAKVGFTQHYLLFDPEDEALGGIGATRTVLNPVTLTLIEALIRRCTTYYMCLYCLYYQL